MSVRSREIRQIERKYRIIGRSKRRKRLKRRLPGWLLAAAVLLCAGAVLLAVRMHSRPAAADDALCVRVLNVGQGDAILVTSQGHAALIDGGEASQGKHLVQMLRAAGVKRLDCIVNSHPHADHIGGLQAVMEQIPAEALILPDIPAALLPTENTYTQALETAAAQQIPVRIPACGSSMPLGAAEITFLSVDNTAFTDLNNCSLGVLVTCGSISFFTAGDLEAEGEHAMCQAGLLRHVSLLKVSHQGSSSSSTPEFLAAVSPDFACISVGRGNDYGHPTRKTIRAFTERGCPVYRTDLDGTVCFSTDGQTLTAAVHELGG